MHHTPEFVAVDLVALLHQGRVGCLQLCLLHLLSRVEGNFLRVGNNPE